MSSNRESKARALSALRALDPGMSREAWVKAAMAAHAAGLDLEDFDTWSANGRSYDPRAARDTWRSIKTDGGVGAGTLFRMAREAGWSDSADHRLRAQSRPTAGAAAPYPMRAQPSAVEPSRAPRPGKGCVQVWGRCTPATNAHGYIVMKDGRAEGLRVVPEGDHLMVAGLSMAGALVVPVVPLAGGEPTTLQFIAPPDLAGTWKAAGRKSKLNLPGATVSGVFIVGELLPGGLAYVVEGIGQAWACWKATGTAAVVCFGWGRVKSIAAELRQRDTGMRLVLVPDAGKETEAEAIALEVGAEVAAMPEGSPSNFDANDYAAAHGHDALDVLLAGAKAPPKPEPPAPPWRPISVFDLATAEIPPQAWAWHEYIPAEEVTLLGAHGGTGKSTIALMLLVSVAIGLPLFGVATRPARVVFFSAEDGADTVRRRLRGIVQALGIDAAKLADRVEVLDATDAPELAGPLPENLARPRIGLTVAGERLKELMDTRPGALLIIDNASDAFAGNENARPEVRAFVRLLAGMVRTTGGAVLLLAHVDKGTSRGERAGSESYSGSTAWHNSARSRLYLSGEKDGSTLVLEHQKSNHAPKREPLRLNWPRDGLPQLDSPVAGDAGQVGDQSDTKALLKMIHEYTSRGESVSSATTSRTHAGKLLRGQPGFPVQITDKELFDILRAAERRRWLQREVYKGRDRKEHERWAVTELGAEWAEISDFSATAATAATSRDFASHRTGACPAAPAATAATSPLGGVGEIARTLVAAHPTQAAARAQP